jgi:ABC-type sugar transport system substrate-binding protein
MKKPTRIISIAFAGAASIALLAGCTATADGGTGTKAGAINIVSLVSANGKTDVADLAKSLGTPVAKKGVKLCYVTRTLSNEFWGFERDGFVAEAKKLGVQSQVFDVTDESSITEQLDKAQSAMNQGCSALLASPISATGLDSVLKAAVAAGIPAIVLNDARSTIPGTVYIGPDANTIGQTAASTIAKLLPSGGKIAMVEGDPGSSNAVERGKGFVAGIKTSSNLDLVASQTAVWDATKAQDIATAMLTANPDIKAIYSQNDGMGLGVEAAIAAKGLTGKVFLVGTDGIPEAKKDIAAGTYTATVSERPTTEGKTGVDVALWLLAGKKVPGWVNVPAFVVDSSNVKTYLTGMP